jgi:ATP-dependent DNA helicase RecQ
MEYIIRLLVGRETDEVVAHGHHKLDCFGCGEETEERMWSAIIRQALIAGYLEKGIENYGIMKLTDKAKEYMKRPGSFCVTEDNEFDEDETDLSVRASGGTSVTDPALFVALKDLRKEISQRLNVPPYVVFQEPSLEAMATIYPITLEELQNIPGVGAGKAKRYGEDFCKLIKHYCEVNEVERPENLRIRTVASKSMLKVSLIESIDRKVALDEIAATRNIELSELLDEIESIVYSGNKLNIDYFIDEVMDEDDMLDIYDYFRESETDDLKVAMDELHEYYSEEDVRLVRIKFISEMAN